MVSYAWSNEKNHKKVIYEIKKYIRNCESAKVISRQNV